MKDWPYPTLLADIGGTQLRFAIAEAPRSAPSLVRVLRTADHRSLGDAAQAYLAQIGRGGDETPVSCATAGPGCRPLGAALAIATPAEPARLRPVRLTNTEFEIDGPALVSRLGLAALWIVNDFEALAWSLPTLAPTELEVIGRTPPRLATTMAVIGPGTGMGCAGLLRDAAGWHAVPGEGGHVTLAGRTGFEREVLAAAADQLDHVSAEKLLSGLGLPLLYRAVATVRADPAATQPLPAPEEITRRALGGSDPLSREVVDTFCALLGGYAGNVALTFGATGGLLIGGGIAAHIAGPLRAGPFRTRFEDKGRFGEYLSKIGTARILRNQPALDGLVNALDSALAGLPVLRPAASKTGT